MSAEGASQPPDGADKAAVPKATGFVSSFINKNTSGKEFAPKAARRRPGAAAAATPASLGTSNPATTPAAVPQLSQPQPSDTPAPEPQATPQTALPTPDATQETARQDVTHNDQAPTELTASTTEPTVPAPIPTPEPTPAPTDVDAAMVPRNSRIDSDHVTPYSHTSSRPTEQEREQERPSKRRRLEPAVKDQAARSTSGATIAELLRSLQPQSGTTQPTEAQARITLESTTEQRTEDAPQSIATIPTSTPDISATVPNSANLGASANESLDVNDGTLAQTRPRRSRRLPWVAVNQPQNEEEDELSGVDQTPKTAPKSTSKPKRRRRADINAETDTVLEGGAEVEDVIGPQPRVTRRRKRTADTAVDPKDDGTAPPAKKPRKVRKDKGTRRHKHNAEEQEGEGDEASETDGSRPKRKRTVRKKRDVAEGEYADQVEGQEGDQDQLARRKGRQRETTPSDAEDRIIDPGATFMDNLASRNVRTGKMSERERRMRGINWEEIKQRRREEEAVGVATMGSRKEVDQQLDQAGEARTEAENARQSGPQFREVNGQIVLIQDSGVIDREGDADREIELMEEVVEDDLTTHITNRSFLRDNKRFPKDFLLPGQGRRWTKEGTEQFYEALQVFGTDFMMISTMFPGTNRRSIKTKFNREERENPARIKAALNAQRNSDWTEYLERTGMQDDAFVDPRAVERELLEERERMQIEIEAARGVLEEENRQKRLAGVNIDEDEKGDGSAKENSRTKKKGKLKSVSFEPEEGLEILGDIDDE